MWRSCARTYRTSSRRLPQRFGSNANFRKPACRASDLCGQQGGRSGACAHARAEYTQARAGQAEISEQEAQAPEVVGPRSDADLDARGNEGHQAHQRRFFDQVRGAQNGGHVFRAQAVMSPDMPRKPVSIEVIEEGDERFVVLTYSNNEIVKRRVESERKASRRPRI